MSGFGFVLVVVATLFYSFSLATTPPLTDTVNLEVIIAEQSAFDNRSEPEDDILETIRGGYFMLPREVINLIQSGTLPYSVLIQVVLEFSEPLRLSLNLTTTSNSDTFSVGELIQDLLQWLVPTLVVIGVGIVVSISIPISGCCFLICRRHNACCARKHEALLLPCHTLKCFLGLCLTLLCSILLLAAIALGVLSNLQSTTSIQDFPPSVLSSLRMGMEYINETIDDVKVAADGPLQAAFASANADLNNIGRMVMRALGPVCSPMIANTTVFLDYLSSVYSEARNISASIRALVTTIPQLQSSLQSAFDNLTLLCNGEVSCELVLPVAPTASDFSRLVDNFNLTAVLDEVDINDTRSQLNNLVQIDGSINNVITNQFDVSELSFNESITSSFIAPLTSIQNSLTQSQTIDGVISSLNMADAFVRNYGIIGTSVGYVLFGTFFLFYLLTVLGTCCGVCGYRNRPPEQRTILSHEGANVIACGIGVTFGLCGLLLSCYIFIFLTATLLQKVCDDIAPPEYVVFANVLDNPSLWGGRSFVSAFVDSQFGSDVNLTVTNILSRCAENDPIYQVLQLGTVLNLTGQLEAMESAFVNPFEDFDFGSVANRVANEILPDSRRVEIEELNQTIVPSVNFVELRRLLNQTVLSISLTEVSADLTDLATYFSMNQSDAYLHVISIRDNLIGMELNQTLRFAEFQKELLSEQLTNLEGTIGRTMNELNLFVTTLQDFEREIITIINEEALPFMRQLTGYFSDYFNTLKDNLENQIGGCQPVVEAYSEVHNALCVGILGALNGLWFSIVWCVIFSLLLIMPGILMMVFFRMSTGRKEDESVGERGSGIHGPARNIPGYSSMSHVIGSLKKRSSRSLNSRSRSSKIFSSVSSHKRRKAAPAPTQKNAMPASTSLQSAKPFFSTRKATIASPIPPPSPRPSAPPPPPMPSPPSFQSQSHSPPPTTALPMFTPSIDYRRGTYSTGIVSTAPAPQIGHHHYPHHTSGQHHHSSGQHHHSSGVNPHTGTGQHHHSSGQHHHSSGQHHHSSGQHHHSSGSVNPHTGTGQHQYSSGSVPPYQQQQHSSGSVYGSPYTTGTQHTTMGYLYESPGSGSMTFT